ncbi:hypothetical protein [Leifsonia naganoensis]|uniref:Type II toxin-antitoxin system RelE/ParE family toxin n=1 Tax=Leifsonia naganoensis TaxID=150025 RepID=A0A853DUV1_9MICO|nr:hypothetical protein [Leifsonia naganoensis]NYK10664.1 hypothetical protein [Leifsonia naganoensis]
MRFQRTPAFDTDFKRLKPERQRTFRDVIRESFAPACDAFALNPTGGWPAALRVKSMRGAPGIYEMTWSFASPDGRATFELVTIDGELYCRWRRVGDHSVYRNP